MFGFKVVKVAENEKALLFKDKNFKQVLLPGKYHYFDWLNRISVEKYDVTVPLFEHKLDKFLIKTYPVLAENFIDAYELGDQQVGLYSIDGKLEDIVPPGAFIAFWKLPAKVSMQVIDIADQFEVSTALLALTVHSNKFKYKNRVADHIHYIEVPDNQTGLLSVNGVLNRVLKPGRYGFWKYNRSITIKLVDQRLQTLEVSGQEILTKDRVSLRINLSATYKVVDAEKAAVSLVDYKAYLYQELQLQLREAVGTKTLDELLIDKDAISEVIAVNIRKNLAEYGVSVVGVGVKDIILPGDMKQILNQVVEAQKQAEANLIKRREETSAMRSLHNTAKMMENNPTLMRLKELEALETIANRIDKITVYGGLDGVMNGLIQLPK